MEYLRTHKWMTALRGGALRDAYAFLYQLDHHPQRKKAVKVSIRLIAEELGYSERAMRSAIAELQEMGWLTVEYTDGRKSIYKTLMVGKTTAENDTTPAKSAPLSEDSNPCKDCTPAKSAPLQDLHHTPAKSAPVVYIPLSISKDISNGISTDKEVVVGNTTTTTTTESAHEVLRKWVAESDLQEWVKMQLLHSGQTDLTLATLLAEFYDNDFLVRERCERGERTETLRHFQNWLPKFLRKLKNENNNANPTTNRPSAPQAGGTSGTSRTGNSTSLDDIARSIAAGFAAGAARRE